MKELKCSDCRYYLPVDVFKGLCKKTKAGITPDDTACPVTEAVPKCKFCANYLPEKEFLGKCKGVSLAYPDMIAAKCTEFKWLTVN